MQFGENRALDIHAAREHLLNDRNRNLRVLQDDDRRRGIMANSAIARQGGANAVLDLPIEQEQEQEREAALKKGGGGTPGSKNLGASNNRPSTSFQTAFVSGVDQLIAPRNPSPDDINHTDTVLCIISLVSAVNPSHSWTMPATSHLWNELEARAFVPHTDPPVPLHRTVVATSTHTYRTLNLLSEYVRDVMLMQTECVTCIMAGATVPSDRTFWTTWDPAVPVDPEEQEAANLAAAEGAYEPRLPMFTSSFPGELLQPAPGLVGRQWPSEQGHVPRKKLQDQYDDDF